MNALADLSQSRDLLVNLTLRELRGKYKRSVLGWSWSLLNPLATMVIFSVVFGRLLKVDPPAASPSGLTNYPVFLLCGLLPWNFLSNTHERLDGGAARQRRADQEGVLPPRRSSWSPRCSRSAWSFLIEMGVLVVFLLIVGQHGAARG